MSRRQFLRRTATVLPALAAGCVRAAPETGSGPDGCTGEWNPSVDADEPVLSPGEEAVLHVEVTDVTGLRLLLPIYDDADGLEFGDGVSSPSPPPDRSADASPPIWYWTDCTDVEVGVPLRARRDARPAEIDYVVHLVQSRDGDGESTDRRYTITITGE
jgi:hypothetical protein